MNTNKGTMGTVPLAHGPEEPSPWRIQVTNACEQVREVFEMTGYDHVVKMV
ncbi:MAG: hypothetical protein IJQ71_10160 [Clostridia bacterium]|nr:hypothetical protein [Clostridia bacterium]